MLFPRISYLPGRPRSWLSREVIFRGRCSFPNILLAQELSQEDSSSELVVRRLSIKKRREKNSAHDFSHPHILLLIHYWPRCPSPSNAQKFFLPHSQILLLRCSSPSNKISPSPTPKFYYWCILTWLLPFKCCYPDPLLDHTAPVMPVMPVMQRKETGWTPLL